MRRRQLLFVVLLNTLISLVVALVVVWIAETRRPDAEELAARYTPPPPVVLIATPTAAVTPASPAVDATSSTAPSAPTSPSVATGADSEISEPEIYVVQQGDSLFGIALQYGLTVQDLMDANNLTDPDFVFSGQRLVIPARGADSGSNSSSAASSAGLGLGLELSISEPGILTEENVQVVNESNEAVNLQGWVLGEVNGPTYAFGDLPLFPGGSVRLHSEAGENDSLNRYWGRTEPVWESGAVARLFNPAGQEIVSYTVP